MALKRRRVCIPVQLTVCVDIALAHDPHEAHRLARAEMPRNLADLLPITPELARWGITDIRDAHILPGATVLDLEGPHNNVVKTTQSPDKGEW